MIATLGKDCIGRSVKRDITGSLRWNDPDQVPWVCSQPTAVGTPAKIRAYLDYRANGWEFKPAPAFGRSIPASAHTRLKDASYRHPRRRSQAARARRSEENTSELQSLMRISYAVSCMQKKKQT